VDNEESALLLASATITRTVTAPELTTIHLDEGKLFIQLRNGGHGDCSRWILDSGATNHMSGDQDAFTEIDRRVQGIVRFGDVAVTNIVGKGSIILKCKNGEHKALAGVYLIPRLTTNIVSLGQLEEDGHKIMLQSGFLKIWDCSIRLVARVSWAMNRMSILQLNVDNLVCLTAQGDSPAWRWHTRYGHLNLRGLRKLATGKMVNGLPL
jgi:hypothetical protein